MEQAPFVATCMHLHPTSQAAYLQRWSAIGQRWAEVYLQRIKLGRANAGRGCFGFSKRAHRRDPGFFGFSPQPFFNRLVGALVGMYVDSQDPWNPVVAKLQRSISHPILPGACPGLFWQHGTSYHFEKLRYRCFPCPMTITAKTDTATV
jgi:hypothetical protein